jgi:tRNA wybutosine-synthesizing protein 1
VDKKKFAEALEPTSAAISLSGEPTQYSRIAELIGEFHKRRMKSFLVTNGTRPDRLKNIHTEPTNLYITISAPDERTHKAVNRPLIPGSWERLNESLELMPSFKCNKVVRLTLVNGLNFHSPEKYAKLIEKTNCDFVEVKSYSWVGESRLRLPETAVVPMEKMREFAKVLAELTGCKVKDEHVPSKVVLLAR